MSQESERSMLMMLKLSAKLMPFSRKSQCERSDCSVELQKAWNWKSLSWRRLTAPLTLSLLWMSLFSTEN